MAGKLVRDACRIARYGGLLKPLAAHKIDNLYYYNVTQHGLTPDVVVDIGGVVEQWQAVMQCHDTQVSSRKYIELQMSATRLLGLSSASSTRWGCMPTIR